MSWSAPFTAVAGAVVGSADFNTYVRDNLNTTMPANASVPGSIFVTTGSNAIAERFPDFVFIHTSETGTSTTYGDLATPGPAVTSNTGSSAIVFVGGRIGPNTGATASVKMSWDVTGATTLAASDFWSAGEVGLGTAAAVYTCRWYLATGLTPGSNTFTARYAVSSGTGTFADRSINVIPL